MRLRKKCRFIWRNSIFLLPSLLGVGAFALAPFGDVLRRSFVTALSGKFIGFANYANVLQNRAFRLAARNTLRFDGVCLPILLVGSLLIALAMWKIPFLERCKTFYLLPMAMPAATVALVWRLIFDQRGFLAGFLGEPLAFLDGKGAFWALIATYVWKNLGYTIVLWLAALRTVPADIGEAARMDGAGSVRIFFHVTLPCLKGDAYAIGLLSFLNTFKVFREVYLIGGAYPGEEIYLLQHVFHNWYAKLDLDKMAAGAALAAAALGGLALLAGRLLEERE